MEKDNRRFHCCLTVVIERIGDNIYAKSVLQVLLSYIQRPPDMKIYSTKQWLGKAIGKRWSNIIPAPVVKEVRSSDSARDCNLVLQRSKEDRPKWNVRCFQQSAEATPETELIRKVQKGNNEKLITVLILTVHIQLDSSFSLPDLW